MEASSMNIILQKPGGPNEYNFPHFSFIVSSCVCMLVILSCPTLCDAMDSFVMPGSSVHGILQEKILERVDIPISRGSSQPRGQTLSSCTAGEFFTVWATREAQPYIQMTKKHMKRYSTSIITRERETETTIRYYLTPVTIKKSTNDKSGEGVKKNKPSYAVGWNVNWYWHYGEQYVHVLRCSVVSDSLQPHGL